MAEKGLTGRWRAKLRYEFDNTLSRGIFGQIFWLGVVTFAVISLAALVIILLGVAPSSGGADGKTGFFRLLWINLNRTLDPGYVGADPGGWVYLLILLLVTFFGIFVFSALISIITSALEKRLDELRRGHSKVIERNHTVIFGWSRKVVPVIQQLVEANRSERRSCVVVYGDRDKVEMEEYLAQKVGATGRTRIVCRSGTTTDVLAPEITNVGDAKSVILIGSDADPAAADPVDAEHAIDIEIVKTLMAVRNVSAAADRSRDRAPNRGPDRGQERGPDRDRDSPGRRGEREAGARRPLAVVSAIHDSRNVEVARVAGGGDVVLLEIPDLVSRLVVQTTRQSGLPIVYAELLSFDGAEFYFRRSRSQRGRTFHDIQFAFRTSIVVGFRNAATGATLLNPPGNTVLGEDDELIVIADDNDRIAKNGQDSPTFDDAVIVGSAEPEIDVERTLIFGWNARLLQVVSQLDQYVAKGSELTMVSSVPMPDAYAQVIAASVSHYEKPVFLNRMTTQRSVLEELDPASYDQIILLPNQDHMSAEEADAHTLIKLLHLRDIVATAEQTGSHDGDGPAFVTEMLDIRNRRLAEAGRADDFIVSDEIISMMLAQLSENAELEPIFDELLDAEGNEIYLRPASDYVVCGAAVRFYDITESACRRHEVAIGYRRAAGAQTAPDYGVLINPDKGETLEPFAPEDRIIVLSRSRFREE